MIVKFEFQNGTSRIHLVPDKQSEKDLIRLFRDEVGELRIIPSGTNAPETLIIQSEKRNDSTPIQTSA
jgi:hypothetical protein